MSRSLGRKAIIKKLRKETDYDAVGRKMFADGLPCPYDDGSHGKAHATARGWKRAAAEARQPKNRKPAASQAKAQEGESNG
ncbi:hypothetical protein GCM10027082_23980 [Comamonas humi]